MEVLGQDGETQDGKPYFKIPAGSTTDLTPSARVFQPAYASATRIIYQSLRPHLKCLGKNVHRLSRKQTQAAPVQPGSHSDSSQSQLRRQVDSVVDQKGSGDRRRMAQGQPAMSGSHVQGLPRQLAESRPFHRRSRPLQGLSARGSILPRLDRRRTSNATRQSYFI